MAMEKWKKVAGKHRVNLGNGVRKVYGPGQPDGDVVEFPIGAGPSKRDRSWRPVDVPSAAADFTPAKSLEVKRRGKSNWYDVINVETEEPINRKALNKAAAEELASQLQEDELAEDEETDLENDGELGDDESNTGSEEDSEEKVE